MYDLIMNAGMYQEGNMENKREKKVQENLPVRFTQSQIQAFIRLLGVLDSGASAEVKKTTNGDLKIYSVTKVSA